MRIPLGEGLGDAVAQPTNLRSAANNPDAFGAGLARVATGIGADMVQKQQQDDDSQAIFEARRKLDDWERTAIWDPQKGAVAKKGRDAFDLPQTLPGEYDQVASEIATSADPRVKRAVQGLVLARREQVTAFADGHALKQREWFNEQSYQADRQNFLDNAALYASDPVRVQTEIALQNDRTIGYLRNKGAPDELIQASVKDNTSRMHSAVLGSLLNTGDVVKAEKYLRDNAGGMNADEYLKAQHVIKGEMDLRIGAQAATAAVQSAAPKLVPTDGTRLVNLVMGVESGGRRFAADGSLLQGPQTKFGTAKGEMQVLDGTTADPGFGVTPARDNSPDERARVGRDYLAAMVRRYDGDLPKALAAYNWGPGNVDQAIVRAGARPGGDWMTFAPAETQNYVAKITKAYGSGQGAPTPPTLQDIHTTLRNDPQLKDNPQRLRIALEHSTAQFKDAQAAIKEGEDRSVTEAMRQIVANGGRYSDLPAAVRAAIPAKEVDNVMQFAVRVAKGDDTTNNALYVRLTDPQVLTNLSENDLYRLKGQLSESDFQHFAQQRQTLLAAKNGGPPKPGDLDASAINGVLTTRLRTLGIDPTPKDGSSDAQQVGAIQRFVRESLLAAQATAGKKFNDAEIEKHIDGLFAKSAKFQDTFLGFNTGKSSTRLLTMKPGDIPSGVKDALKKDFKAAGIENPTNADLLGAYFQLKSRGR